MIRDKMASSRAEEKKFIIARCLGFAMCLAVLQTGEVSGIPIQPIDCEKKQFFAEGKCQTCPDNCINCSSATTCLECKEGFFGPACEHTCPNCFDGGRNICHKDYGHCTLGCEDGTFSNAGFCTPCPAHCPICGSSHIMSIPTNCIFCEDGYWGNTCQQKCQGCSRCEKTKGQCPTQAKDASSVTVDKGDTAWHIGFAISVSINVAFLVIFFITIFKKSLLTSIRSIISRQKCTITTLRPSKTQRWYEMQTIRIASLENNTSEDIHKNHPNTVEEVASLENNTSEDRHENHPNTVEHLISIDKTETVAEVHETPADHDLKCPLGCHVNIVKLNGSLRNKKQVNKDNQTLDKICQESISSSEDSNQSVSQLQAEHQTLSEIEQKAELPDLNKNGVSDFVSLKMEKLTNTEKCESQKESFLYRKTMRSFHGSPLGRMTEEEPLLCKHNAEIDNMTAMRKYEWRETTFQTPPATNKRIFQEAESYAFKPLRPPKSSFSISTSSMLHETKIEPQSSEGHRRRVTSECNAYDDYIPKRDSISSCAVQDSLEAKMPLAASLQDKFYNGVCLNQSKLKQAKTYQQLIQKEDVEVNIRSKSKQQSTDAQPMLDNNLPPDKYVKGNNSISSNGTHNKSMELPVSCHSWIIDEKLTTSGTDGPTNAKNKKKTAKMEENQTFHKVSPKSNKTPWPPDKGDHSNPQKKN